MEMTRRIMGLKAGCVGLALALLPSAALAADLAAPQGDVILTVSGLIATTNADGSAQFDLAMLQAMDVQEFTTTTIWTEGEVAFTGAPLAEVLRRLGIESGTLRATAVNDYAVAFPVEDALVERALIAYRMNGEPMSVRDKGPLWIVYRYDSEAKYQSEEYYSRSIWQLDRIIVEQ